MGRICLDKMGFLIKMWQKNNKKNVEKLCNQILCELYDINYVELYYYKLFRGISN